MALPTKEDLLKATNTTLPDIIDYNLKVLFVGINPGLYTALKQQHFGRPGNRFWPTLYSAGFTKKLLHPSEQNELLKYGYGITNVIARASVGAAELTKQEYIEGGNLLEEKIKKYSPQWVAFVGIEAYRKAFNRPKAKVGRQIETIGKAKIWVLPNPSGLNAHFKPADFTRVFSELYNEIK